MSVLKSLPAGSARNKIEYLASFIDQMGANGNSELPITIPFNIDTQSVKGIGFGEPGYGMIDVNRYHPFFLDKAISDAVGFDDYVHSPGEVADREAVFLYPMKACPPPELEVWESKPAQLVYSLSVYGSCDDVITLPDGKELSGIHIANIHAVAKRDIEAETREAEPYYTAIASLPLTITVSEGLGRKETIISGQVTARIDPNFNAFDPDEPLYLAIQYPDSLATLEDFNLRISGEFTALQFLPQVALPEIG
ncbi:hypothetical protein [Photobacterium ganghwense]|uniref:hypothetical protein n=1 Tax=Photobacterium ganghwense TaxID=320778 RepID=UPI0039EFC451